MHTAKEGKIIFNCPTCPSRTRVRWGPSAERTWAQPREAADALLPAYNQIADGSACIRDANSIPRGRDPIDRGVEQLRTAAQWGRNLPTLSPGERAALICWGAPPLLGAIDRVLRELRRLKATPGLRLDFDRLINAYSKAREEVLPKLEHR